MVKEPSTYCSNIIFFPESTAHHLYIPKPVLLYTISVACMTTPIYNPIMLNTASKQLCHQSINLVCRYSDG